MHGEVRGAGGGEGCRGRVRGAGGGEGCRGRVRREGGGVHGCDFFRSALGRTRLVSDNL